jgi:hypothetical protein
MRKLPLISWRERGLAYKFGAVSGMVRSTTASDKGTVLQVVRAAFSGPGHDGEVEVGIVGRTWELGASPGGLELVAVIEDVVVGHVPERDFKRGLGPKSVP